MDAIRNCWISAIGAIKQHPFGTPASLYSGTCAKRCNFIVPLTLIQQFLIASIFHFYQPHFCLFTYLDYNYLYEWQWYCYFSIEHFFHDFHEILNHAVEYFAAAEVRTILFHFYRPPAQFPGNPTWCSCSVTQRDLTIEFTKFLLYYTNKKCNFRECQFHEIIFASTQGAPNLKILPNSLQQN